MRGPDGKPRVCERVWISYLTGSPDRGTLGEGFGKLTAGYGSRSNPAEDGGKIGPEFTFGLTMEKAYDGPILIIKTAWGGKSLNTDFRPPSAGPYEFNETQLENLKKQGKDIEQIKADKAKAYRPLLPTDDRSRQEGAGGPQARRAGLRSPRRATRSPGSSGSRAGTTWSMAARIPNSEQAGRLRPVHRADGATSSATSARTWRPEDALRHRRDGRRRRQGMEPDYFRQAMAAPASSPEFKGNVAAVETARFWDSVMESLLPKKAEINRRFNAAYLLSEDGVMENPKRPVPAGNRSVHPDRLIASGVSSSFDPQNKADQLPKTEKKRFRQVTLPAGLEEWYVPEFDDSKWNSGTAPIGKGDWQHRDIGKATVQFNSDWGDGEFLLMRTTFRRRQAGLRDLPPEYPGTSGLRHLPERSQDPHLHLVEGRAILPAHCP